MRNKVLIIQNEDIRGLKISSQTCMAWVEESFKMKYESQLPAKVSVHPQGNDFFTSMPVLLPPQYGIFGIKEVYRILGRNPSLSSDILLYDSKIGKLLAILDGDWITTMRTGAVAALTIKRLQKTTENSYSFIGLGSGSLDLSLPWDEFFLAPILSCIIWCACSAQLSQISADTPEMSMFTSFSLRPQKLQKLPLAFFVIYRFRGE